MCAGETIVSTLLSKNGNTLVVECPDDVGTMHSYQTKLRQTLFNLLSNAAKFTDHGNIQLRVTQSKRRADGESRIASQSTELDGEAGGIRTQLTSLGLETEAGPGRYAMELLVGDGAGWSRESTAISVEGNGASWRSQVTASSAKGNGAG